MTIAEIDRMLTRSRRQLADAESQVELLRAQVIQLEAMRDEAQRRLHSVSSRSTLGEQMEDARRVAISKGRTERVSGDVAFLTHVQAAQHSLRSLAAALGIKQPTLSAHRKPKGHANSRPIPASRAAKIEKLTGWPANAKHWPAGITSDGE